MFELAEQKLKNKQPDLALLDLEKLLDKYPNDSLAANALYKMSTIHLHWNNNLSSGYNVLKELVAFSQIRSRAYKQKLILMNFQNLCLIKLNHCT